MAKKEAKANNKENAKNKKSFWKSFKAELKKVTWPTPKQLANNTSAVIAIVVLTAIIVFASRILSSIISRISSSIGLLPTFSSSPSSGCAVPWVNPMAR